MSVAGKGNFRRPKQESVEELFGKVPPQNLDAEKAVLGSILLDNVVIRAGAGSAWSGNSNHAANLFVSNSIVEMVRTRLEDSALYPVSMTGTSVLEGCTDLAFTGNADSDVYVQSPASYRP